MGKGGPLWSPAGGSPYIVSFTILGESHRPTGDHKGPPCIHPATLAPTEF